VLTPRSMAASGVGAEFVVSTGADQAMGKGAIRGLRLYPLEPSATSPLGIEGIIRIQAAVLV